MFKKFFTMSSILAITLSLFSPMTSFASAGHDSEDSIDWKSYYGDELDEEQMETAEEISNFFKEDKDGNIIFTADKETLMEMGISESDAELMISAGTELSHSPDISLEGFVGIHLILGPKVRNMSGWAAGTFAGGYVGWYAKNFAVNPVTAGVAALITASTVIVVKNAVEKGLKRVSIGTNIPFLNMAFNVKIP